MAFHRVYEAIRPDRETKIIVPTNWSLNPSLEFSKPSTVNEFIVRVNQNFHRCANIYQWRHNLIRAKTQYFILYTFWQIHKYHLTLNRMQKKNYFFEVVISLIELGCLWERTNAVYLVPSNQIRWFERVTRGHGLSYWTTVHFYTIFRVWFEFTAEFKFIKNEPAILLTETHIIQLHKRHLFSSILTTCRTLDDWS